MDFEAQMEDLPVAHQAIIKAAALLQGKEVIPVRRLGLATTGRCHWNVLDRCGRNGGKHIVGWMLTWLPGVYIRAYHHGVWERPGGELLDPTAAPHSRGPGETTFMPADLPFDRHWPPIVDDQFIGLIDDPAIAEMDRLCRANAAIYRDYVAEVRKSGGRWVNHRLDTSKLVPSRDYNTLLAQSAAAYGAARLRVHQAHGLNPVARP